jgi:ubiquinone/menaquinone biosynthesis C-methylase UbiE
MPDEKSLFHPIGLTWGERASLGGLEAVLSPQGAGRRNMFLHGANLYGARRALRYLPRGGQIIDFGCGNGRFSGFLSRRGRRVWGTEITPEMIEQAKQEEACNNCHFLITNGVDLPFAEDSIDGIWCCGVLRLSLFVENPAYNDIAKEMHRVLRPGAFFVNCEMYVDVAPQVFIDGYEKAGFSLEKLSVLLRDKGFLELILSNRRIPEKWLQGSAQLCALIRSKFDNPWRETTGLRDYLFVWRKMF